MRKCSTCETLYAGDLCPKCMAGFVQKPSDPSPASAEDLPLKTGQTFHGLEIVELLGRGGMGVVYKAKQPALDRQVALKILPQKMALDPDFQNRFIREAKALGALSHPNIVAIYDFGAENGLFFFAMEFVDGVNLRQVLRERKLTPEQALKIVPQLCDALEYAHAEGVVHRDIKPENIMIDRKGRVKIADFGLAKITGADRAAMLTMTNMVMGTPHYMAPEQVENPKAVDHRADIYSMGVVFYEMLTGELPIGRFEAPSKKVQIDVRLDDVVLKSLEKQPERRYQRASDVKEAVSRATSVTSVESYSPTVVTPRPARKSPAKFIALLAAAVILAALATAVVVVSIAKGKPQPDVAGPTDPKPLPPMPVSPGPPAPIDLTPLHFGPEERPLRYVFARTDAVLTRNPLPAKEGPEIESLVRILGEVGLQNVDRSEVKQGYLAIWWGGTAAFAALETPVAERIERAFSEVERLENRWTYRKGNLLVLAWAGRRERRDIFNDLVGRLQKKLGLPAETPAVPLENLKIEKSSLAKEWLVSDAGREGVIDGPGAYSVAFHKASRPPAIYFSAYVAPTAADAESLEARHRTTPAGPDVVRKETLRTGRTVAALNLKTDDVGPYEKVAEDIREWMGHAKRTFDTIVPNARELPPGFAFEKVVTDPQGALQALALTTVNVADVAKAWVATFKPAGIVALFEVKDSNVRSEIEGSLRRRGPAWSSDSWVWAVEAPDDESLDALENRVREKFGWDRNPPRPIQLLNARILPTDLPPGFSLENEKIDRRTFTCTLKGADTSLDVRAVQTFDYGKVHQAAKEMPYRAGDILLVKDTVAAYVGGPEAAWPVLEKLETTLRKKMRMGAADLEEMDIPPHQLPPGSIYIDRAPAFTPNPRALRPPSADVAAGWEAVVDPSETHVTIFQMRDSAKAAAWEAFLRKSAETARPKNHAVFTRDAFVIELRQPNKADDAAFRALGEIIRGKLRLARK